MKNKTIMRKLTGCVLCAGLALTLLAGCTVKQSSKEGDSAASSDNKTYKVGIVQHMDHPSLNQISEQIQETLKSLEDEGKVELIVKNASGDQTMLPTIIKGLINDGCDILVPIATPTAQAAAAATSDVPIVFSAVSNPVEAGLVESFDKTDSNITGVSDSISVEEIFKLAAELTPDAKTFGFVYNTSEINSVTGIKRAKDYCDKHGLKYKEATVTSTADVQQAANSLVGEVDAFFTPDDNTVASAMTAYVQAASAKGKPVYCGADSMVNDGGFATVGIDYNVLGRQTGELVKKVIDGEKILDLPVEQIAEYAKMINVATAKTLGIEIPKDKKDEFQLSGE